MLLILDSEPRRQRGDGCACDPDGCKAGLPRTGSGGMPPRRPYACAASRKNVTPRPGSEKQLSERRPEFPNRPRFRPSKPEAPADARKVRRGVMELICSETLGQEGGAEVRSSEETHELLVVHGLDGGVSLALVGEGDEAEAARATGAGLAVDDIIVSVRKSRERREEARSPRRNGKLTS